MREKALRVLRVLAVAVAAGAVTGACGGWLLAQFLHIPQVDQLRTHRFAATTHVLAADGEPVAEFALERRVELKPEQIPESLKQAIVAIEDADFFDHGGVDPTAILRAAYFSLRDWEIGSRGG